MTLMAGPQEQMDQALRMPREQVIQLLPILFCMQSGLHRYTQLLMIKMAQVEHLAELQIHLLLGQHL